MINQTYKVKEERVISETLEGETIIINLDTGNYYSTNAMGAIIWGQIQSNICIQNMVNYFTREYDVVVEVAERSILETLEFLLKEDLIVISDVVDYTPDTFDTVSKKPFIAAKIDKYDDMQEMLFADPVHDVSESEGWPKLKHDSK